MQTEQSKKNHSETNFKTKLKGPRLLPQNWAHFDLFRTPLGDSNHPLPRCLRQMLSGGFGPAGGKPSDLTSDGLKQIFFHGENPWFPVEIFPSTKPLLHGCPYVIVSLCYFEVLCIYLSILSYAMLCYPILSYPIYLILSYPSNLILSI